MRSRVVPMRDMREKFGTEVKDFPYAFVLKQHYPGWDSPPITPVTAPPAEIIAFNTLPALVTPVYIEVKPRP